MADGPLHIQEQSEAQEAWVTPEIPVSAKMVEAGEWVLNFADSYPSDLLVAAIFRAVSEARGPVSNTALGRPCQ
jgi:hypothetical protein